MTIEATSRLPAALAQALAPFAPAQSSVHEDAAYLARYRAALASFDWQFEFSDDHTVWAKGVNALARLRRMQLELDPSGAIWLATPGAQSHGAPCPHIAQEVAA